MAAGGEPSSWTTIARKTTSTSSCPLLALFRSVALACRGEHVVERRGCRARLPHGSPRDEPLHAIAQQGADDPFARTAVAERIDGACHGAVGGGIVEHPEDL